MKFLNSKTKKTKTKNIKYPKFVENLNGKNFTEFLEKYPNCFIDFYADWCKPCKNMTPRIRRLSKIYQGKIAFAKVDTQKEKDLAKKYKIMGLPTYILFINSKEKANFSGERSIGDLKKIFDKYI